MPLKKNQLRAPRRMLTLVPERGHDIKITSKGQTYSFDKMRLIWIVLSKE
jgi:hypothetical protein